VTDNFDIIAPNIFHTDTWEVHPNFEIVGPEHKSGYPVFDMAIATLAWYNLASFGHRIRPICLPYSEKEIDLKKGIISGW
jgi:hypothetical protein